MTATFVFVDLPRYHTWVIPIRIGEATVLVVSPYSSNIMVRFVSSSYSITYYDISLERVDISFFFPKNLLTARAIAPSPVTLQAVPKLSIAMYKAIINA